MTPPSPAPAPSERRFTAFLSYRHDDNKEIGRQWASWLHQALETYTVPPDLASTPNSRGEEILTSLYPIFRDEEELPANATLSAKIRQALRNSATLIVLCSPRAIASRYVADEIRFFKELGKADRILALIIDGEPNADDPTKVAKGITPAMECLPEPLRYGVVGADGTLDWTACADPIAADARPEGRPIQGWTTAAAFREEIQGRDAVEARLEERVRAYEEQLERAKLKVIAGILGVDLGALTQRDQEYRRREAERRAEEERALREEAESQREAAQRTLSAADFLNAEKRLGSDDSREIREGCAYLGRSIRLDPGNRGAAGRLLTLLQQTNYSELARLTPAMNHASGVCSVAFSPDGKCIATGSRDMTARVWDALTGMPLTQPLKHENGVAKVFFSRDGAQLLTRTPETVTRVWNALSGELQLELNHDGMVSAADFSPDGSVVVTGTREGQVCIWDSRSGTKLLEFPVGDTDPLEISVEELKRMAEQGITIDENGLTMFSAENIGRLPVPTQPLRVKQPSSSTSVQTLCFSPEGKRLLITFGESVAIFEVSTGKQVAAFSGHEDTVYAASFSADGRRIATGSKDGTARIWNAATGETLVKPIAHEDAPDKALSNKLMPDTGTVSHVEFSPDGNWLVTASANGQARVWDSHKGKAVSPLMEHASEIHIARFSPDGLRIVTASSDSTVTVWDARRGSPIAGPFPHPDAVFDATFSPDGKWVASAAFSWVSEGPAFAQIWDARAPEIIVPQFIASSAVTEVQMSDSGAIIAGLTTDGAICLWEMATARALCEPLSTAAAFRAFSFHPRGERIATGAGNGKVQVWDACTGKSSAEPFAHPDAVIRVDWSADGHRILTGCADGSARLWDVETLHQLGAPQHIDDVVEDLGFTENGRRFVLVGVEEIELRDANSGDLVNKFTRPKGTSRVAISRGGSALALLSGSEVRLWDPRAGEPLSGVLEHPETFDTEIDGKKWATSRGFGGSALVMGAVFSADGRRLLTWAQNRAARVWDAATGNPATDSIRQPANLIDADISADGGQVLTACDNGGFYLWDTASGHALSARSLGENDPVKTARFSPDGRWIILTSSRGVIHLIPHISTAEPVPGWMADLAEVFARRKVTENGAFVPLERNPGAIVSEVRARLKKESGNDSWTLLGRWLLADVGDRTFSPFATLPLCEYLREALEDPMRRPEAAAFATATGHGDLLGDTLTNAGFFRRARRSLGF